MKLKHFDDAFLEGATLSKARTKKDLIKPNNISFLVPKLDQGRMD